MAHGYFTTPISENLHETPEGFLVARDCVIARTGWQTYTVADLPQEAADSMGVDLSNPSASIDLYRRLKDVFDQDVLHSFEGKAVTDSHPPKFVDPDNFNQYARGHVQNVRKGNEALESGDWPMIADIHITAEPLLSRVRNKHVRELSCGYDYSIEKDGDKICQTGIVGNHVAVVPKGRAGEEARINDHDPTQVFQEAPPVAVEVIHAITYPPIKLSPIPTKEKHPVAETKKNWKRFFMGKHLIEMARATDADPEEVMSAAEALREEDPEPKPAKDGELPAALKEHQFGKKGEGEDKRKAMHDALDRMMDEDDEPVMDRKRAKDKRATDADIEELKELLNEYLDEEKDEPEHKESEDAEVTVEVDPTELEEVLSGGDDPDICPECDLPFEDCECDDPGMVTGPSGEETLANDELNEENAEEDGNSHSADPHKVEKERTIAGNDRARAVDSATAVLRMLRPAVAKCNDASVKKAWNTAHSSINKVSRASTGSYGKFAASARARDAAPRNPNPDRARAGDAGTDAITKMQNFYDNAHKGGK